MKKSILIAVLACSLAVFASCNKKKNEDKADGEKFGSATLALIDGGKYELACEDAKSLAGMINDINKDFAKSDAAPMELMTPDNMTPAMKNFETVMDDFGKRLEAKLGDDKDRMEEIYQGIGDGISGVFQVSLMTQLGMVPEEKLNEYIEVTYCGVAPKEGYVSPLDADMDFFDMPLGGGISAPDEEETPKK